MFCNNCGTQLSDDSNFCSKCGKPQKEGVQPYTPRWETCEITFKVIEKAKKQAFLVSPTRSKIRFWAKAIGTQGEYSAGESKTFEGELGDDWVPMNSPVNKEYSKIASQVFDDLVTQLSKNGWDYVGNYGDWYYEKRFRRVVK